MLPVLFFSLNALIQKVMCDYLTLLLGENVRQEYPHILATWRGSKVNSGSNAHIAK